MRPTIKLTRLIAATGVSWFLAGQEGRAESAEKAELDALREEVRQLEQQLEIVKHRLDVKEKQFSAESAPPTPAPVTPRVTIDDRGVTIASADGANAIKLRGLVQLDSRLFFGDGGLTNNAFVLRRARIITEGTFARNVSYQFVPEFGGSTVSILDANFTVGLSRAAQLKFGKFKEPIGLERLQSDSWTFFDERSIMTNLTPDRDLGIQVAGDLAGGVVSYAVGVFGGLPDGGVTNNSDFDNEKDGVARVMTVPFKASRSTALRGLSLGVGASSGRQKTAGGRTAGYKTDGQQTFFTYNSGVVADGRTWRFSPQLDYRSGPLGILGEYIVSTVNLRASAAGPKSELRHHAWQAAAGYVLTGEDSSYNGVVPRRSFDWSAGTWGAFEVTTRVAQVKIDDAAFPIFASPASSADEAKAVGFGLNWYLNKMVRFTFDYYQTEFGLDRLAPAVPSAQILRQSERALITRFQLSF